MQRCFCSAASCHEQPWVITGLLKHYCGDFMPTGNASPLALFLNASAGSGEADELLELWERKIPEERKAPMFVVRDITQYSELLDQALEFCKSSHASLIVAGGDGSFNGVLTRPESKEITLGLIPTGTFNFFARSHGIPEDPETAIEFILAATPVTLALAYVNERPFIVSVSIGVHPKIIAEREIHTRYVGRTRFAAWLSGIWTILRARHLTKATLHTATWRRQIITPVLLVNFNSAQLLGLDSRFQHQPHKLAMLRLKQTSYWGIFAFLFRALSGRVLDEGSLQCEYVEELVVDTPRSPERVALDGELVYCKSPMKFRVEKHGFSCLLQSQSLQ